MDEKKEKLFQTVFPAWWAKAQEAIRDFLMNKRSLRYKKPHWTTWVYEIWDESEIELRAKELESFGYIVER